VVWEDLLRVESISGLSEKIQCPWSGAARKSDVLEE